VSLDDVGGVGFRAHAGPQKDVVEFSAVVDVAREDARQTFDQVPRPSVSTAWKVWI